MQVTGQSSVGITNSTFLGCVNANSEGGALAIAPSGLVQVCRFGSDSALLLVDWDSLSARLVQANYSLRMHLPAVAPSLMELEICPRGACTCPQVL
jgi:hypothetical protein